MINAKKEGEGAQVLWKMVGEVASELVARNVHQHAVDESNHAQYYVKILQWTFPGCAEGEVEQALQQISPRHSLRVTPHRRTPPDPIEVTLDEMVQMNIGEIRTRVHQLLPWPAVLEHCPPEHLKKVRGLISTLLRDETRHIAYTAQILEQAIAAGRASSVRDRMAERFEQFCDLTRTELGGARFEGS
ncbi:MAG TPA: hypothetical protein VFS43_45060 [Polyangiaceae bacterium]|nr:hypothetical protein [Polyangiaceae bacterium]